MAKQLPQGFTSWRDLYFYIMERHPQGKRIRFEWRNPIDRGNPNEYVQPERFTITMDTLKKKCWEEHVGKIVHQNCNLFK